MPSHCLKCGSSSRKTTSVGYLCVYVCQNCGYRVRAQHAGAVERKNGSEVLVGGHAVKTHNTSASKTVRPNTKVAQPVAKEVRAKTVESANKPGWTVCSVCQVKVLSWHLQRHMKKVHPHNIDGLRHQQTAKRPANSSYNQVMTKPACTQTKVLETCPFCGISAIGSVIRHHIRQAHRTHRVRIPVQNKVQKQQVKAETVGKKNAKSSKNKASTIELAPRYIEEEFKQSYSDSRDASKSYANSYRENGRFGSHPVHDDYGDESWPD